MKAVLDANVLYPATLRSLLIDLAVLGAYQAHWTAQIQQEWQHNLLENRPDLKADNLQKVEMLMNRALPGALIVDSEELGAEITLPDPDDAHVVTAALQVEADVIVTANLRDFPESILKPYGMVAMSPDQFLGVLFEQQPARLLQALQLQVERYRNPPLTLQQLLDQLAKQGIPRFAKRLQEQL